MDQNNQILSKKEIEQVYLDLINEYGAKLPQHEKVIARELFQSLYNKGKSWEWIYWAIWQLGERRLTNNKGLLFYADYQKEVNDIAKYAREYIFDELTIEQFMEDYVQWIVLYEKENPLYRNMYDRLEYFDNKYWNTEEDFTEQDIEELSQYYKEIVKDVLRISRLDYELERRYIAGELRRVYGGIYDVPPHPYVNMDLYINEITEENRRKGIAIGFYKE